MDRRSLPLNALRTFDAAARHLNYSRAAEELGVTHGAISRQITALEASLNTSLFVREVPLRLTPEGRALHEAVSPALDAMAEALDHATRTEQRSVIFVDAPPTFTMKWLIPRLSGFQRRFPDAEVRLSTGTNEPGHVKLGDANVLIRRLPSKAHDISGVAFLSAALVCVCAPELVEYKGTAAKIGADGARDASAVLRHRLIEAATNRTNWTDWLAASGLARPPESQFVRLEEMFYAVQAALDGLGMALVPLTLVADDLAAGRLVMPVSAPRLGERDYCYLVSPAHRRTPLATTFCDWLASEGRASNELASHVLEEAAFADPSSDALPDSSPGTPPGSS